MRKWHAAAAWAWNKKKCICEKETLQNHCLGTRYGQLLTTAAAGYHAVNLAVTFLSWQDRHGFREFYELMFLRVWRVSNTRVVCGEAEGVSARASCSAIGEEGRTSRKVKTLLILGSRRWSGLYSPAAVFGRWCSSAVFCCLWSFLLDRELLTRMRGKDEEMTLSLCCIARFVEGATAMG